MMGRAKRVCTEPGCPELVTSGRCTKCRARAEQARGTRQQRGYDRDHDKLRAQWKHRVEAGMVDCARCGDRIAATESWHLDHDDDRTGYLGPSHARCNTSAGGRAAHAQ